MAYDQKPKFEQKPNSGAIFENLERPTEDYPNFRGDIYLDKTFLIEQMNNANGSLVKIAISAWSYKAKSGKNYMSLTAAAPWIPPEEKLPY